MPILQVNFKLDISIDEYRAMCRSVADAIAQVPRLQWKLWILNEDQKEAGGLYFFSTQDALENYAAGPIVAKLKSHPGIRDLSVKTFGLIEDATMATRGPVGDALKAHAL